MFVAQKHTRYSLASLATVLRVRMWWSLFRPIMISPDLIWTTDVSMWWSKFRPMVPPDIIWTNYRRQWLRWLHSRDRCGTKHIRHSLAVPRDCTSSQIAMILVQTYGISSSHLNNRDQLLRRLLSRDGCGNITYQTLSFFPSSMFEESECDRLSSDLRYLQITFGPPNVNVTRHQSCSKSQEFLDQAWRDTVPAKWCCRYLGLHNNSRCFEPSATITSSMCSVKLLKKRCRSVLIDVSMSKRCMGWLPGMII